MNSKIEKIFRTQAAVYFILFAIILLGFLARTYKIQNPIADWHSWRQADTASVSKIYYEKGIDILFPKYHDISSIQSGLENPNGYRFVEFPIFNIAHVYMAKLLGNFDFVVVGRLVAIFSSLISIYAVFYIGRWIGGNALGLTSAFFFSFLPFNIYFSRAILPESMCVMFIVVSLVFFIKYVTREKAFLLLISAVFFALAMLIKPFAGFYLIPLIYIYIRKFGTPDFKKKHYFGPLIVFIIISLLPLFIWRVWESRYPEGIPFFDWAFNGDKIRFRPSFWRWIFGERLGLLILGIWGLIPFVFGILSNLKKNHVIRFMLLGVFSYVVVVATASVRHDYYQVLTIPAIALTLGAGTIELWNTKLYNNLLARGVILLTIPLMFMMSWNIIKENYKVNHPEIIKAGRALDKIAPKDSLVIAPYNGDTAFLYQTGRLGWPAIDSSIGELIEKGADYFISVNFADPDTIYVMDKYTVVEKTQEYVIVDLNQKTKNGVLKQI